MSKGKVFLGTVFGALTGFVAGVLTAPKSGKETREDLKEVAQKTRATAEEKAEEAKVIVTEKAEEFKTKAEEVVADVKEKTSDVANEAADRAVELKGRTEQAIEGAKKGFEKKPTVKR